MKKLDAATERLFGEVLDLPREERSAFLDEACRGTPELRRVVEELLLENDRLSGFLSDSPYAKTEGGDATEPGAGGEGGAHSLSPGTRLGRYSILSPLGAGGMGVVYRARDERLERQRDRTADTNIPCPKNLDRRELAVGR